MSAFTNRRRDFLKVVGGAAASTALPQKVWSANDRIVVGFVGVGVMGSENLKAAMNRPEVAVAAV
ncbi:MAG: twin-arginine translocation signal domain-containing protein, partial [bacterium]|nr:twin-arginine translocation signal domain-containing protein [bacterium]